MSEWQLIETAPRDEFILTYSPIHGTHVAMIMNPVGRHFVKENYYFHPQHPTHWMPAPQPPKEL